jgi:hypothetical protein
MPGDQHIHVHLDSPEIYSSVQKQAVTTQRRTGHNGMSKRTRLSKKPGLNEGSGRAMPGIRGGGSGLPGSNEAYRPADSSSTRCSGASVLIVAVAVPFGLAHHVVNGLG